MPSHTSKKTKKTNKTPAAANAPAAEPPPAQRKAPAAATAEDSAADPAEAPAAAPGGLPVKPLTSDNVIWHNGFVQRGHRETLHGHKGLCIWFTGLSASGKSTIAHYLERQLHKRRCSTYVFDGDNVRHGLCGDLTFSPEDRSENIRRIGEMSKLFVDAGIIAITAFISPYRSDRQRVRDIVGTDLFLEIFVDCPVEVCASRDPKGIYQKAAAGVIKNFTGISAPYEPPQDPALVIRSDRESIPRATTRVLNLLVERGFIQP